MNSVIRQNAIAAPGPDQGGVRIRVIDTPANVQLAIVRLRQAFSALDDISPERPCRGLSGKVRVYVTARF
jgi:hypothetical protein